MLSTIATASIPEPTVCAFSMRIGDGYRGQVLFIGRAPNGWGKPKRATAFRKANVREQTLQTLQDEEDDGLEWVYSWGSQDPYNPHRSAFWRIAKSITISSGIAKAESNWADYVAWSNLYKISNGAGPNPSSALRNASLSFCKRILENDILSAKPKRIVFLTDLNWARPFIEESFKADQKFRETEFVDSVGTYKSGGHVCKCIIAKHPQGKGHSPFLAALHNVW